MSTPFNTGFSNGETIETNHFTQYVNPINDLESGASHFRVATNSSGTYQVNFLTSANPEGHAIDSLSAGQMIVFKASHNSPDNAQLKVSTNSGEATHPLFMGGVQINQGEITSDQIVTCIFNDTSPPRFDVVGVRGFNNLGELTDVALSSPSASQVLRYDGNNFVNATLAINDVDDLNNQIVSAGGTTTGHLTELQALTLSEGDMLTTNSGGEIVRLPAGAEGHVLKMTSGVPAWGEDLGGGDLLHAGLVATGYRYENIASTSDDLRSSAFTPIAGRSYLIRYLANHSTSTSQLDVPGAIANDVSHFCQAEETGSSTVYNIGLSSPQASAYPFSSPQRCRPIEFVWTAPNSNEVEIVLGQPTLLHGGFTGTIHVYQLRSKVTPLGWGFFSTTYSWLEDKTNTNSTVGGGAYRTGLSLDSSKTYAFVGCWLEGYSASLCLRQGSNFWRLPPDSSTFSSVTSTQAAWNGATYYGNASRNLIKGEIVRYFSPPNTGTFDLGCNFFAITNGCFFLAELD